jgi:hypothetical protein
MTKPSYEVTQCKPGQENLQMALDALADQGGDVISVVSDHGSGAFGTTSGSTYGYLIVVRRTD